MLTKVGFGAEGVVQWVETLPSTHKTGFHPEYKKRGGGKSRTGSVAYGA